MDLTTEYTIKVQKFYGARGFVPGYHDIHKHKDVIDEIVSENNMSPKDAFVQFTKLYKEPEKMLYEIYYDLFGSLIYQKFERKEFLMMDYPSKAQLVFKKIPGFMKNRFNVYHMGFLMIHYNDKKTFEMLAKTKIMDPNSEQIVKKFLF